jgi:hypothetical protein
MRDIRRGRERKIRGEERERTERKRKRGREGERKIKEKG